VVTSGGINVSDLHPENWRDAYKKENPSYPDWFTDCTVDLTSKLKEINIPVLLIWGDSDPISPVAIGERLNRIFPDSRLEVINEGDHALANKRPKVVATLIDNHLHKK